MKIEPERMRSLFGPDGEFAMDESAPTQESMRGDRRFPSAPSTDQKKIRRRLIHRSGSWGYHYARKTATVLNTQIERLNNGDQIRTPTGQTSQVKGIRPHETDSTLVYLDTDQGTSTVKKGTDFQVVPHNSQQQELPDIGNPAGGNAGALPGAGHTPGGPGAGHNKQLNTSQTPCPNCGNTGTLHLQGGNYICSTCGYTISAGGSPGGLLFTNQPHGIMPHRRKPGEVPKAHVWASKYITSDTESQIARRARQVLGEDE